MQVKKENDQTSILDKQLFEGKVIKQSFSMPDEKEVLKNSCEDPENVVLEIDPEKFEKKKDNLFFDFFSMYTKNVISGKSKRSKVDLEVCEAPRRRN